MRWIWWLLPVQQRGLGLELCHPALFLWKDLRMETPVDVVASGSGVLSTSSSSSSSSDNVNFKTNPNYDNHTEPNYDNHTDPIHQM